jgi:hypothetical protein
MAKKVWGYRRYPVGMKQQVLERMETGENVKALAMEMESSTLAMIGTRSEPSFIKRFRLFAIYSRERYSNGGQLWHKHDWSLPKCRLLSGWVEYRHLTVILARQ